MKKLTRKNLDELAQEMPVINEMQQRIFIGGGDIYRLNIDGTTTKIGTDNESFDTLTSYNSNGATQTFSTGILGNMMQQGANVEILSATEAKKLFEFCADNSLVEFGATINIDESNSGNRYLIYTNNSMSGLSGVAAGSGVNYMYHSHVTDGNPSPTDYSGTANLPDGTVFGVYYSGNYAYFWGDGMLTSGSSSGYVPGFGSGTY
jgi:hypothetical protein